MSRLARLITVRDPLVVERRPRRLGTERAVPAPVAARPTVIAADPIEELRKRHLRLPVEGLKREDLRDTFNEMRGGDRRHEALDILAPRDTPVLAVDDGTIAKLFLSKPGGITIYQFDPTSTYAYYYAHSSRYAEGLKERRGRRARSGHRLRRDHRQRAAGHAAPALRHLQADRREALVAGDRHRSLPAPQVAGQAI